MRSRNYLTLDFSTVSFSVAIVKLELPLTNKKTIYSLEFSKKKNVLSTDEWKALSDLRSDNSIIIMQPYKGNGVVIVRRFITSTK